MRLIWVKRETENFLTGDWTTQITLIRFNKTAFCVNRGPAVRFRMKARWINGPQMPSAAVLTR
jgi:hypothetical protein